MKKIIVLFSSAVVLVIVMIRVVSLGTPREKVISPLSSQPAPSVTSVLQNPEEEKIKSYIFVPYWTIEKEKIAAGGQDGLVYFGVKPTIRGIDTTDDGYKKISVFNSLVSPKVRKYMAIRLLDSTVNFKILEDTASQELVIQETIALAKEHAFDGILLDLEVSSLPFESVIKHINSLTYRFYIRAKANNLVLYTALFGDAFYRVRPYDVGAISQNADRIFVMAYDFHKAGGNPGPNFPLHGKAEYGYDYEQMIDDYTKSAAREKLTIVFGMFGYDWLVSEKKQPEKKGESLSFLQIKQKFIDRCVIIDCAINRDEKSSETKLDYTDSNNNKHIVWFEDEESAKKKKEYLQKRGITSTAFWAYSYY